MLTQKSNGTAAISLEPSGITNTEPAALTRVLPERRKLLGLSVVLLARKALRLLFDLILERASFKEGIQTASGEGSMAQTMRL